MIKVNFSMCRFDLDRLPAKKGGISAFKNLVKTCGCSIAMQRKPTLHEAV
jgi:hypothetical protein